MRSFRVPRGGVTRLAYSSGSEGLFTGDASGAVHHWDLATGTATRLFTLREPDGEGVTALAVSDDGRLIAAASDPVVGLWDAEANALRRPFQPAPFGRALDLSPDGRALAGVTPDWRPAVWDVAGGTQRLVLPPLALPEAVAFSPDGRRLAIGREYHKLTHVYDVASGQEVARLEQEDIVDRLAFARSGGVLAAGGGSTVRLWDTADWRCRATIRVKRIIVRRLALHPQGTLVATAGDVPVLTLWDAEGRERGRFDWKIGKVLSLAFAPDGMTAAGGSNRNFVVWDVDEAGG
jgi:WD40 repeat protein